MTFVPSLASELAPYVRTLSLILFAILFSSCSVADSKTPPASEHPSSKSDKQANAEPATKGATITIEPNGPADTVRVFYKLLREKKFREALFLTNLRPAIEGLTDNELNDFALDFEAIAGQIPAEVEINGEIISGDSATVTAMMPNEDGDKNELQTIKLASENGIWRILTVDEEAARNIKKQGKNYFYQLRIETHEEEARKMLERISKAQLAHSLQNGGLYTDIPTLISGGLLPDDVTSSTSTGYNYALDLAADKKKYSATATPAEYGKSGKLSFLLHLDAKGMSRVSSKDMGGKPMTK